MGFQILEVEYFWSNDKFKLQPRESSTELKPSKKCWGYSGTKDRLFIHFYAVITSIIFVFKE